MGKGKVLWITRTALLTALLIVLQAATSLLGNQLITGSSVNMVLAVAVMIGGLPTGLAVAIISPIFATLLGISSMWPLVPFIVLGNVALVLVWHFIGNRQFGFKGLPYAAALVAAAVVKFLTLYVSVVLIAVPYLLNMPEAQAEKVSAMFSITQMLTALIGGAIAALILPSLKKAVKRQP